MPLDDTFTFYGPFDLDLYTYVDGGAGDLLKYAITSIMEDSIVITGVSEDIDRKVADGSKVYYQAGREIIIEITLRQLDPTATTGDLDDIEEAEDISIEFTQLPSAVSNDTIVVADLEYVSVSIEGFKMKIVCKKSLATLGEWSSILALQAAKPPYA